ncbi:MAG: ABC transporter permease/substrate-binding protein [Labilithrix sp.]|nr:ABC transporter permease/substrate-binding protein [Labilithrix sp.]MCW5810060.1 ABC transporter permease/substrate-binding protein [Labilithrix sp.]
MTSPLREAIAELPALLAAHVTVAGLALGAGTLAGLALAIGVRKSPRWRAAVLGLASVVQTIPSLALLALMVPLLGTFGFWPALSALILYSLLPVLRNTVAGLDGVPAEVLEAADAVGMSSRERLRLVELPIALPVILAGVRTGTAWVIGTATLTTPVGQPSLGNLIFAGLQTRNWGAVLAGCLAAAALALVLDALLASLETAARARSRPRAAATFAALLAVFVVGVLGARSSASAPIATSGAVAPGTSRAAPRVKRPVVVGAKTFTEQYILAELIAERLRARGIEVEQKASLGSSVVFDALTADRIGVYVDYSGTLWANVLGRTDVAPRWRVNAAIAEWLSSKHGARMLGPLGFENAYAIAMRRERASALGVRTIADLRPHAPGLALGGDYEFFQRPEWRRVRDAYGLAFPRLVNFDASFLYDAIAKGDVDAIAAFSSDGRIALYDLVVLEDTVPALPPYDAVLLLSPALADDAEVVAALSPLVSAIRVEAMREATLMVDRDRDKRTVREAAEWLSQTAGAPKP